MAKNRPSTEINAGSMADIAFLLLIFFLVTTTIASDKGIYVQLPPKKESQDQVKLNQRNVFNVLINSNDLMLVEEELMDIKDLREAVKEFVTNNGVDPRLSESPKEAVVSLKTDRGTSYEMYIGVLDEIKTAYTELRAAHLGVTVKEYMDMEQSDDAAIKAKTEEAKAIYPYQVSDAEPTDASKTGN
jgi:biopolymer transport protein ExbD